VTTGGLRYLVVVQRFIRTKAWRFGASCGDAWRCHNPLGGAIVVSFHSSGLRVKTLDHLGLDDNGVLHRHPLGGCRRHGNKVSHKPS
jgi:hypothetical protein